MPSAFSLNLVRSPGNDGKAIEACAQGPGQCGRIGSESGHEPLVPLHHFHPLPLITWFRLFATEVFGKDVLFGIVPVVFIIKCCVPPKLECTVFNGLFRLVG